MLTVLGLFPSAALAQGAPPAIPQGFQKDPYVVELQKMIEEWNGGSLMLPSKSMVIQELQNRTKEVTQRPPAQRYGYETAAWAAQMLKQTSDLPEKLTRELPIDNPATSVLLLLYIKNLNSFKTEVKAISEVRPKLQSPLFLILATAQSTALSLKRKAIDADAVVRSVSSWWTTVWPICDK
jgi:hypothetical protein